MLGLGAVHQGVQARWGFMAAVAALHGLLASLHGERVGSVRAASVVRLWANGGLR